MTKIVFATNNKNKLSEVKAMLGSEFKIISLEEINCFEDIPEDGSTLKENALQKAKYVFDNFGLDCFADDTGLLVDSLNGDPGIYSARYAGEQKNSEDNMNLLLCNLKGEKNRNAHFSTVVCLLLNGQEHYFEGKAEGEIIEERTGNKGFGYDPIFRPSGYQITFAEMDKSTKNEISHRGKAVQKLVNYLQEVN